MIIMNGILKWGDNMEAWVDDDEIEILDPVDDDL